MTPISTDSLQPRGKHDSITQKVIGVFFEVYNELGYGFLESVYSAAMDVALTESGIEVEQQVPVPVLFRGRTIGVFKADMIVDNAVLIELKACEALVRQHESQTLNYLRATSIEVALLMNFGPSPRFKRLIMDNEIKVRPTRRSVPSVLIGVKPLPHSKVAE